MDVSQYLEIFIDETKEHLQNLSQQLMVLEEEPDNADTINEIFRAAHSLKGMAGTMGYKRMQHLTHIMENALSEIRNGKMTVNAELVDVLFQCLDALEAYLDNIVETQDEGTEENEPIIARLNVFLNGGGGSAPEPKAEAKEEPKTEDAPQAKDIKLNEYEVKAINEAFNKNMNVYSIEVHVDENCILKAARAFLVFKALEELGEIIKSDPSAQDIEDERFEFEFTIVVITEKDINAVKKAVENVSEIRKVVVTQITNVPKIAETEETAVAKKEEASEVAVADKSAAPAKASSAPTKTAGKPVVNRSVRVDIEKLDVLMNLVSELIIAKNGLMSVSSNDEGTVSAAFNEQVEYLERVTTNLHESVMKVRMMPIETVTQKFPKMVRDLSKKLDKQMKLFITGEDTELDRTVIDEIGDPLMHLIRNSADHGLEDNATRAQRGKDSVGNIYLDAYQDGNNVVIEVRDDGNGIDVEKIRNKAIEKGTVTPEQAEVMTDKEVIDLLFQPSFSTAKQVTDVSGRGVGLDVVKTKIESLGGDIEVKTMLGEGSTFIIRLPLTLAIIQSLMVEVGGEKYAISLGNIQTIEDVLVTDIKYVQSKEVINLRGTVIPLIRLDSILDIEPSQETVESLTAVIVKKGDRLAGLIVDSLIGQQEIVIKSLGKYMSNNSKIISGATILGDGEVALILDTNALV
ncbi:MAG: chemotaxis protein CheA [Lachnospiraceae bacterium]|nr:chemotaxis protein CheA [Lachnospiraceae bacterium]MEE0862179.1 chemotaxis protein CheA [Lachnospiraceae bacterium]